MGLSRKAFIMFLALILSGACVTTKQPRNKIDFYTLEYEPPSAVGLSPLPVVIRVERFSVAPTYNTNRIIYRDNSFKRNTYTYHKWRANPGDLITYFLSRDLKLSGLFRAVLTYDSGFPCSHMVEGSVDEFYEWDSGGNWKAVLGVSITLMAENEPDISKRVLFQKTYRATKMCPRKNPAALAESMSMAMSEVSSEIIRDINDCLKGR